MYAIYRKANGDACGPPPHDAYHIMAEAAPAPLRIAVGSKNPVKLAAVRQAFFRAFPDRPLVCVGHDVPSGCRPAVGPRGDAVGRAPARARALLAETGADYAVGIEGGVVQAGDGLRSVAYVAIRRSRDMRESVEHTASFKLPPRWRAYSAGRSRATANSSWAPPAISYLKRRTRSSKGHRGRPDARPDRSHHVLRARRRLRAGTVPARRQRPL